MSDTRKLYPIALIALLISVGSLFLVATPCNIANGQTICDIGDTETISDSLIIQNELQVGSTPTAGIIGQALTSGGAGNSPEWGNTSFFESVTFFPNDVQSINTLFGSSAVLTTGNLTGDVYSFRLLLIVTSPTPADIRFELNANSDVDIECVGFTHDQDTDALVEITDCDTTFVSDTDGSPSPIYIEFLVNEMAPSGIQFRWSQNAVSGTTTINEGSWMAWRKIS